jgi:hypothetical protein
LAQRLLTRRCCTIAAAFMLQKYAAEIDQFDLSWREPKINS